MKQMIKRKDGSYSQRGLWDNIRANKGSGKAPTKEMLKQEKKIKMATKVKKAQPGVKQKKSVSPAMRKKIMDLGAKSDSLIAVGMKKGFKKGAADMKAGQKARQEEIRLSRKAYGTGPSDRYKKGGKLSKKK